MRLQPLYAFSLTLLVVATVSAADYRVELLPEAPPVDELSSGIAGQLAPTGLRVIRGTKTTYCDIWLLKEWQVMPNFEPTAEVLYPFAPGQLVGVARFARSGADCRDQRISKGLYTLRYAQQPVDGAHVGTSLTRDFLLLVRAGDDQSGGATEQEELIAQSSEAAQSSHPCLLSMQRAAASADEQPTMRHDDEQDFWIIQFRGKVNSGDAVNDLPVELLIVGVFQE